ncbi:MAG TPA: hypothetical protein VNV43_10330 [Candidatus Acidoferrales bacterium]|jgi:hypothetical protein|nr:hypothetical protein [Candidatus Acidoferrales bacterium]
MKRLFVNGILSTAFVATCLIARGGRFLYSTNNLTWASSPIWEVGRFEVREYRYWTDASGHTPKCPQDFDHPIRRSTEFSLGAHSIMVTLSPKCIAVVGATGLVILGLFTNGFLIKKRSAVVNSEPRTTETP